MGLWRMGVAAWYSEPVNAMVRTARARNHKRHKFRGTPGCMVDPVTRLAGDRQRAKPEPIQMS